MPLYSLRLVRIVAEKSLRSDILALLSSLGARGYTYFDAAGFGAHGMREAQDEAQENVVVEVLASEHDAEIMLRRVHDTFVPRHGLIAYLLEARTLQREKFF